MDDILCAAPDNTQLQDAFKMLQLQFEKYKLIIAPEKIQTTSPFSYLGFIMDRTSIKPQKVQISRDRIANIE